MEIGRLVPVGLALAAVLAGCGDDGGFSPTVDNVAGSYSASEFTLTDADGTLDLLALGAVVDVTLAANGTTSGTLFVPGGGEGGEDFESDLTGTWALDGSTVTFAQTGDNLLPDVEFTASRDRLTGEATFGDDTVRLVLDKAD